MMYLAKDEDNIMEEDDLWGNEDEDDLWDDLDLDDDEDDWDDELEDI